MNTAKTAKYVPVPREEKAVLIAIANIANHGGLLGFTTEAEALQEIRKLSRDWWDKGVCDVLQRGA